VQFLFRYHALLQRYFTGTEKSDFQETLAKIGQFFVYNFAKKGKNWNFQKTHTGEKEDLQHSFQILTLAQLGEILFYWYWILIWLQCKPQQGSWGWKVALNYPVCLNIYFFNSISKLVKCFATLSENNKLSNSIALHQY